MSRVRPRVVFWDNLPSPYGIGRYNTLADRRTLEFSVWFSRRTEAGRSWEVDESAWRFDGQYVEDPSESLESLHRFVRRCDAVRPDLVVSLYGERAFVVGHLVMKALGLRTSLVVVPSFDAWVRRTWWKEAAKATLFRSADAAQVHAPPPGVRGTEVTDAFRYAYRYGFPKERAFGVTQSFDLQLFAKPVAPEIRCGTRRRLGVGGCVFLYVGRLWKPKGLLFLIEAYRRARLLHQDMSLLLVGDGMDEQALRAAAAGQERIVFAPFVQPRDLPACYAAADVFVFPTLGDPFGLVIEEAHAAGLPVITSAAAGDVRRRVIDGVTGFVVPAGDGSALADKMLTLATDPGLRQSMGDRGARRVREWGHERWADDFECFVNRALALSPRATLHARITAATGSILIAMADIAARARIWRKTAARTGVWAAVHGTLPARANRLGMRLVSLPWRLGRPQGELRKFGTEYHGWVLPVRALERGGVCYSVGVGEDTSLEDDVLRKTDCRVWSFDPTPRAIAHASKQAFDSSRFQFTPAAVWDQPGRLRLFAHPDAACDTYSPVNLWRTNSCIEVPCTTVAALMRQLGHDRLLLLKITVGGGEWRLLESLLRDPLEIRILCVKFCQPVSFWRVAAMVVRLRRAGYRYCCHDRWKFTFVSGDPDDARRAPGR